MRAPRFGGFLFGITVLGSGCGLALGLGDFTDAPADAGSSSSSSSSTGSSSSGVGGSGGGCKTPLDCPKAPECVAASCNGGVCGSNDVANGTEATTQKTGDCKKNVCDGAGAKKPINDDTDLPVDATKCTDDVCTGGVASNPPTPVGTKCTDAGGAVCDGAGKCVACVVTADCTGSAICQANKCVPATCGDQLQDGAETDVDCGGGTCGPCADGLKCVVSGDCIDKICMGNVCQAPQCNDGVQNGAETDVDCGGSTCPGCAFNQACVANGDCLGGSCVAKICVATCTDTAKNGAETDIDCGGGTCPTCGVGSSCTVNLDCTGMACIGSKCAGPCADQKKDGNETDVDCGGSCAPCAPGKVCGVNGDCTSGDCGGGVCSVGCAVQVATGNGHTCALKADGTVWCWGSNVGGECGDGTSVSPRLAPVQVISLGPVVQIAAGGGSTCARKADGTLWCWGGNSYGNLGDGTTLPRYSPVQAVPLGSTVVDVAMGPVTMCARKGDGTLWCCGNNANGEVGNGTTVTPPTPVQVAALGTTVTGMGLGFTHTCARKADGTLWCWGKNTNGEIGDGTLVTPKLSPVLTAFGTAAAEVKLGDAHTCARKTDGTVWCWGFAGQGQLGTGTTTSLTSPGQVTALGTGAVEIAASADDSCARKSDGTLWCWGWDKYGNVGDGVGGNKLSPVQVPMLGTSVVEVAAGTFETCARKADATLWCWGVNTNGEVGDGTIVTPKSPPVMALLACP